MTDLADAPPPDPDADAKAAVVAHVEQVYFVGPAARAGGVDPRSAYAWVDTDPDFAADVDRAQRVAADLREIDVWTAARSGDGDRLKAALEVARRLDADAARRTRKRPPPPPPAYAEPLSYHRDDDDDGDPLPWMPPARRPHRLARLTPEVAHKFYEVIAFTGLSISEACKVLGVAPSTYYLWMRRGRERKSGVYVDFLALVEEAAAVNEARLVGAVARSSLAPSRTVKRTVRVGGDGEQIVEEVVTEHPPDIRGAEFLLKTRYAQRYSERTVVDQRTTVTTDPGPQEVSFHFHQTGVVGGDAPGGVVEARGELMPADPLDPALLGDDEDGESPR